jgi:hypothetical protein
MREKAKRKKRRGAARKQSSTVKNVALLFLSLGLLTGASLLFSYLGNRSDLSLDPIQKTWNGIVSQQDNAEAEVPAEQPERASSEVGGFDYTFYDILAHKGSQDSPEEHYSVQIGAFRSRDQAKEFARDMKERARVSFRIDTDGKLSCVRWGSFTTREAADKQCAKLSDKLGRTCIVVKM